MSAESNALRPRAPETQGEFPIQYYRVDRNKWTFQTDRTRKWAESWLQGRVLNAFAGETALNHSGEIVRNDANPERPADHHRDVNELGNVLEENTFDSIIHDPPWSERQSMQSYEGYQAGEVGETMELYHRLLRPGGLVISLGFTTTVMPARFGYERQEMAIFETMGRGDDYLGCVVKKANRRLDAFGNDSETRGEDA